MERQPRLPWWFLAANWALIAAAFLLGILLTRRGRLPEPQGSALDLVYHEILRSHVNEQDGHELLERAITEMVRGLDPYSAYIGPRDVDGYEERSTGHYHGIGAEFDTPGEQIRLRYPLPGGPAERAGLLPGDRVLAVDGIRLDTPEQRARLVELVRGEADTDVRLLLQRDAEPFEVTVRRADVQRPCVKWTHLADADAGLGYTYLTDFHPDASTQLLAAIDTLQREGTLRGLVLDLRFNGGGSLEACVAIARTFLRSGVIVSQHTRDGSVVKRFEADAQSCRHPELPLVLIVNEESASASEVLAGALQDHGRASVVGERTFGKGFVNTVYEWEDHAFRLKLTTSRYRTPGGRDIEHERDDDGRRKPGTGGIPPDVEAGVTRDQKRSILTTLRVDSEPPAAWREAFLAAAARFQLRVNEPPRAPGDPQLAQALTALRARCEANATPEAGPPDRDKPAKDK